VKAVRGSSATLACWMRIAWIASARAHYLAKQKETRIGQLYFFKHRIDETPRRADQSHSFELDHMPLLIVRTSLCVR